MAFNFQTFKTRALTAIVFVAVMLCGLLINHWTFLLLFSIIHFGCWIEYQRLIGLIDADYKTINLFHKYGVMLLGWGFMLWMTNKAYTIGSISVSEVGWWLMLVTAIGLPVSEVLLSRQLSPKSIGHSIFGLLYISLPWGCMIGLRNVGMAFKGTMLFFDFGWAIPITLIASIWINDTMAYIVGSFIGKTPFSKISPKKTWEGTAGGAILAIATVSLLGYFVFEMQDYVSLIVISSLGAIVGTAGDLLESKLKRLANVKDSGQIMPGHGGFLDRFDSLLLATPFVWVYVIWFL